MGQIKLEGIVGPMRQKPSRFTECDKKNLDKLDLNLPIRDSHTTYQKLTTALSYLALPRMKGKGEKLLDSLGLDKEMVGIYN